MNDIFSELFSRYPCLEKCGDAMEQALEQLTASFSAGGKLLLCGNGGSAADCEHIVGELMKGFLKKRPLSPEIQAAMQAANPALDTALFARLQGGLPAISLTGAPALSTAFANDVDPDLIFAQQLLALGRSGDVLLGISTSGNAKNVCAAAQIACAKGILVIALTGGTGGRLASMADIAIIVPESETFRVQELHLPVYHALCAALEERFFCS